MQSILKTNQATTENFLCLYEGANKPVTQSIFHLKWGHQDLNTGAAEHAWLCSAPSKGCVKGTEPLQSVCGSGKGGKRMDLACVAEGVMSRCTLRAMLVASLFQLLVANSCSPHLRLLLPLPWEMNCFSDQAVLGISSQKPSLRAKPGSLAG